MANDKNAVSGHTNPDAITGAPGSHPGATAIGTASGTAAGAVMGMAGGPIGIAIGAIAGGIVGAVVGHDAGEWHDPSDHSYWKDEYKNRPYFDRSADFENDVAPAYRYGSNLGGRDAAAPAANRTGFSSVDTTARSEWDSVKAKSKLTYDQARNAVSDAYNRKVGTGTKISDNDNISA